MHKALLMLKVFLRNRSRYTFVALTIVLVLASILGAIAASSASSSYMAVELTKRIPIHIVMTYSIYVSGENSIDLAVRAVENASLMRSDILGLPSHRISSVTTTVSVKVTVYPENPGSTRDTRYTLYINSTSGEWGASLQNTVILGTIIGDRPERIKVLAGNMDGDGLNDNVLAGTNLTASDIVGDDYVVSFRAMKRNTTLGSGVVGHGRVSFVFVEKNPLSNMSSAGLFSSDTYYFWLPLTLLTSKEKLINILEEIKGGLPSGFTVDADIRVAHDMLIDPRVLPLSSMDTARRIIDDIMEEIAGRLRGRYGGIWLEKSVSPAFFLPIPTSYRGGFNASWAEGAQDISMYSPLADTLATVSFISSIQSSVTIIGLSLPVLVASWYLLTIISGLIADWGRRTIALLITRGETLSSAYRFFMASIIVTALIGTAAALPFAWLTGNLLVSQMFPGISLGYDAVFNTPVAVLAAILAGAMAYTAATRVKRIFRELNENLSQLTQVYVPPVREEWRPGTGMRILFILSVFKYVLWATGLSLFDIANMASRIHWVLVIVVMIYMPIDYFVAVVAPFIVTYFITMYITHSEKILDFLSRHVSTIVAGELGFSVKGFIMRGSTRLYRVSFVITLIIAVAVNYVGTATSLEEWYPRFHEWVSSQGVLSSTLFIQELMVRASIAAYRAIAYYSVFIAVLSAVMLALILVRDMDRELAALRARGASIGDTARFVYGVVFTIVVVSLVLGTVSGLIWLRGGLATFTPAVASMVGGGLEEPAMVFSPMDLVYVLVITAALFATPLAVILVDTRKPVAEKLRVI